MISDLELTNYRGFERFRLSGLGRVNLLVGRNNSGKTSILEAVNLLDAIEDPAVLARIALNRGEIASAPDEYGRSQDLPNISHLFHGHEARPGTILSIRTDSREIELVLRQFDKNESDKILLNELDKHFGRGRHPVGMAAGRTRLPLILSIAGDVPPLDDGPLSLLISDEGALISEPLPRFRRPIWQFNAAIQLITAGSLGIDSMKAMWDRVNIEGRQSEVIAAMQILEPSLKDLFFLTSDKSARYGAKGGIVAAFEGRAQRVPLGSYGEGMRRLLALSLALVRTRGGTLLVDEIDTGLHYSIMGELWHMVVGTARRNDVQVFATTHSLDCVRGIAWLCENHPKLAEDVSLQKIEPRLEESVALDAEGIRITSEQGIEVR